MPPFLANFLISLLVGLVINVIAYLLMPKPKGPKPDAVKDLEAPTAEAGMPVPVPFGDITISGVNVIFYSENESRTFKINA